LSEGSAYPLDFMHRRKDWSSLAMVLETRGPEPALAPRRGWLKEVSALALRSHSD